MWNVWMWCDANARHIRYETNFLFLFLLIRGSVWCSVVWWQDGRMRAEICLLYVYVHITKIGAHIVIRGVNRLVKLMRRWHTLHQIKYQIVEQMKILCARKCFDIDIEKLQIFFFSKKWNRCRSIDTKCKQFKTLFSISNANRAKESTKFFEWELFAVSGRSLMCTSQIQNDWLIYVRIYGFQVWIGW